MKIGITGDRGALCLRLVDYLQEQLHVTVDKISLFGDEWKALKFDYDVLIHIAGVIPRSGVAPEEYYRINRDLTDEVAKKASKEGTKHLIYFSTMAVYGITPSITDGGYVGKNTVPAPCDDYGKSKLQGEEKICALESETFKATYLRIPSVYFKGQTSFINVAREMYSRFPRYYPKLCTNHARSAIYGENLCKLILLVIERKKYGVICPADAPGLSLYDYMGLINQASGNRKKPSAVFGMAVCALMIIKPSWKAVFGRVCFDEEAAGVLNGDYRVTNSRDAILQSMMADGEKQ